MCKCQDEVTDTDLIFLPYDLWSRDLSGVDDCSVSALLVDNDELPVLNQQFCMAL